VKREAAPGGAKPVAKKPAVKAPRVHEAAVKLGTVFRFKEGEQPDPDGSRFRVILIREGMGNLGDRYYYSRDAITNAAPIFEGKKIFADHPKASDEEDQPERSVRDILGHFEDCEPQIDDSEGDGRMGIEADVVILPGKQYDWARSLMQHALEYSQKYPDAEFIGLSINASGDAQEMSLEDLESEVEIPAGAQAKIDKAKAAGVTTVKYVTEISDAVSCDLVTNPGAGGKVKALLETERTADMAKVIKQVKKTTGKVREAAKKEAGAEDQVDADAAGEHGDEDQDRELIMQILDELGLVKAGSEPTEAGVKAYNECKEAMARAKEMAKAGKIEEKDTMTCAKHALQMSSHIAETATAAGAGAGEGKEGAEDKGGEKPAAKAEAEEGEEGAAPPAKKDGEGEDDDEDEETPPKKPAKTLESEKPVKRAKAPETFEEAQAEILRLSGKLAAFEAGATASALEKHLDKKLKESGLSNAATKKFREKLGTKVKTSAEIDEKLSLFKEAYDHARNESGDDDLFGLGNEKSEAGATSGEGESLADCVVD